MIDRRAFIGTLAGGLLAAPLAAEAEQARPGVPRIGLLSSGPTGGPDMAGFGRGLRDLGYVDGQNIVIEHRYAKSYDELPRLAAELVGLKVDVIFAQGSPSAQVARDSIRATPVVFTTFADPVRTRLVASLAHPGGNLTGLTMIAGELAGKRLQVIREILPRVSHVAVLLNPASTSSEEQLKEARAAARVLNLRLDVYEARTAHELDGVVGAMKRAGIEVLFPLADTMFFFERARLAALAKRSRLPTMFHWRAYVEAGGLTSYGPSWVEVNHRAATYVDRILKGAKPADLPVEEPSKLELVINLKTAKALGLTIPPSLLQRADQVIE